MTEAETIEAETIEAKTTEAETTEVKEKKPRKPRTTKKKLLSENNTEDNNNTENTEQNGNTDENTILQKIPKKRGRKPKGGKIVQTNSLNVFNMSHVPNIILHLKCGQQDLTKNKFISNIEYEPNIQSVETFQFDNTKTNELGYSVINNDITTNVNDYEKNKSYIYNANLDVEDCNYNTNQQENTILEDSKKEIDENQVLWSKLKELTYKLHTNTINDKKPACFWCTCDFDNPMILIPKHVLNKTYHCYGCFCSPECACAFLFQESIDTSTKFERYHLLNHIYCKIYNYEKNIKPAPNPFYTLNKYYGNLTIQEYRKLLKNERLLMVVDKPLSRILPELHEDNDDMISNGSINASSNKFKLRRKPKQTKSDILSDNFNFKN